MTHGLAYGIPKACKYPDEAYEFAKFMASEQAQYFFGETGTVIPARGVAMESFFSKHASRNIGVFRDAINYSRSFPYTNSAPEWTRRNTQALDWAWIGEKTVPEALAEAAAAVNAVLAEEYGL